MKRAIKRAIERLARNQGNRRTAGGFALAASFLQRQAAALYAEDWQTYSRDERRRQREEVAELCALSFVLENDNLSREELEELPRFFAETYSLRDAYDAAQALRRARFEIDLLVERSHGETAHAVKKYFERRLEGCPHSLLEELEELKPQYSEDSFLVYLSMRQGTNYRDAPLSESVAECIERGQSLSFIEDSDEEVLRDYVKHIRAGCEEWTNVIEFCDFPSLARDYEGRKLPNGEQLELLIPYLDVQKIRAILWPYGFELNGTDYLESAFN